MIKISWVVYIYIYTHAHLYEKMYTYIYRHIHAHKHKYFYKHVLNIIYRQGLCVCDAFFFEFTTYEAPLYEEIKDLKTLLKILKSLMEVLKP
jgi:hypothetical protein